MRRTQRSLAALFGIAFGLVLALTQLPVLAQAHTGCSGVADITGNSSDNVLDGDSSNGAGHDHADTIFGASGHDRIHGYTCRDVMYGGDGGDEIHGADGNDFMNGDNGHDDPITCGAYSCGDLTGGNDDDEIHGNAGADFIEDINESSDDSDDLYGGLGPDYIDALDDDTFDEVRGEGDNDECYMDNLASGAYVDAYSGCEDVNFTHF